MSVHTVDVLRLHVALALFVSGAKCEFKTLVGHALQTKIVPLGLLILERKILGFHICGHNGEFAVIFVKQKAVFQGGGAVLLLLAPCDVSSSSRSILKVLAHRHDGFK